MKKRKNIFRTIGVGLASICMLSGVVAFLNNQNHIEKNEVAEAYQTITNSVPNFFATSNVLNDYYAFINTNDASENVRLYFDVEKTEKLDNLEENEREKFKGVYADGENYSFFNIDNISISLNGNNISSIDFTPLVLSFPSYKHTTDVEIDNSKTYYELVGADYVVVETPSIDDIANYYDTGTPYSLPVYPEALDVCFDMDLSQSQIGMTGNTITLNEQGLVELSISYTQYFASMHVENNTKTLIVENSLTSQSFSYSFLALDKNSYLENFDDHSPKLTYDEFDKQDSTLTNYKYNFYYNYNSNNLPHIDYNVTYFELSIIKTDIFNNSSFNKIVYNPSTSNFTIYDENGDIVSTPFIGTELNDKLLSIYFYDLGEYTLSFETIFINGEDVYSVAQEMKNHKVYVFGVQSFYTISSGNYAELKTYNENHTEFSNSADQTKRIISEFGSQIEEIQYKQTTDVEIDNTKTYYTKDATAYSVVDNPDVAEISTYYEDNFANVNVVSSNRRPLKFRKLENVSNMSLNYYFRADGEKTWGNEESFSISDNFTLAGDYIVAITYNYGDYVNNDQFTQYFTFKITQNAPSVDVYKIDGTNISDDEYLNEDVFINFAEFDNIYNKPVSIYLERYNFLTGTQESPELINWSTNGINYIVVEGGKIKVSKDGNYIISITREGRTNPIQRKFNIDTVTEFNLGAYNVELSQISQRYYAGTEVDILTNQSIVFSWDALKASGARTYGVFKHYSLKSNELYSSSFLSNYLGYFLDKNSIPVEYQLDLSTTSSWSNYTNFDYAKNLSQVVSSEYIKSDAGLYIIQTYDSAGNSQTKIYIIDNTSPIFLRQSAESLEYFALNHYNTVTEDSSIIWSKYKAVFINKASDLPLTNDNLELYKNRLGVSDNDIQIAFQKTLAGDNMSQLQNSANLISKLTLPYENSIYSGYYLTVEIEDDVYFKNYFQENYTTIYGHENDYKYDIVTSYKIWYVTNQANFYRTTTADEEIYISVDGLNEEIYPNTDALREVSLFLYDSTTYIICYDNTYYLYNASTDRIGQEVSVTENENVYYYNGRSLTSVEFVDKEGQYCFLIMDQANTKLSNKSKTERFLTYPSAFQYISITGDKSGLSIGFASNNETITLADSSVVQISEVENGRSKSAYYLPTNENVLKISFTPTTSDGDKTIQVKDVKVTYYEFVSKENILWDKDYSKSIIFNEYKDLSTEKTWETTIYEFDGTEESGLVEYELNINDDKTSAGYYIITRTYFLDENVTLLDGSPKYIVSTYDYYSRTLNVYVDRHNVLTQTETIAYSHDVYTLTITQEEQDYTLAYHVFDNKYVCIPFVYSEGGDPVIIAKLDQNTTIDASLLANDTPVLSTQWERLTDEEGNFYATLEIENYSENLLTSSHTNYTNEKTGTQTSSSTQSLIGGNMLVTMFSKYKYKQNTTPTVISIAHPGQTQDGLLVLNSGDSFYTRQNTSNLTELSAVFDTNKLPISISIPKYKYISNYQKNAFTTGDSIRTTTIYNYAYETDDLSYFFGNYSISSYELSVEVYYFANGIQSNENPTKVYKSDGTSMMDAAPNPNSTGYLTLREYNPSTGAFGTIANEFFEAGDYYVKITQAANEVASSAYNFKTSYAFSFKIEENKPEFSLYSGTPLKSVMDTNYYKEEEKGFLEENSQKYYTNKDEVTVSWTDSSSVYETNIDKTNIKININGNQQLELSIADDSNIINIAGYRFTYEYNEEERKNSLSFSLKNLGITSNDQFISITMQYIGHESGYYETTTKEIIYDNSAPYTFVNNLYEKLSNSKYNLSLSDLREYYLADGGTQTNNYLNASYNQTTSSEFYSKYAFTVDKQFFKDLKHFIEENINEGRYSYTTFAYITKISSYPEDYHPSSNTYDFVETADTIRIVKNLQFDTADMTSEDILLSINEGNYYEIVEKDLAGNITIYVVYVANTTGTYLDDVGTEITQGIHYTVTDESGTTEKIVTDEEIKSGKYEIFANTTFELTGIDFLNDKWNYFYVMTYNSSLGAYQTNYYLSTPTIEEGYVYRVSGNQTKTYTKVSLSSLFENQNQAYKNKFYMLDKATGNYFLVNLSISNTAVLSLDVTGSTNSATMAIALPASILNSELYVSAKPVKVIIVENDTEIYHRDNDSNSQVNNSSYSYIDEFSPKEAEKVVVTYDNAYLRFTISGLANDTRITFSVTDNFGNTKSEIYLVGETKVDEIVSNGNLYYYNTIVENEYSTVYISSTDVVFSYNTKKYDPVLYYQSSTINLTDYSQDKNKEFYISKYTSGSIVSYTFASTKYQFDALIKIELNDSELDGGGNKKFIKNVFIRLYNMLPFKTDDPSTTDDYFITFTNSNGIDDTDTLIRKKNAIEDDEFITVDGKSYKVFSATQTFSDELKVTYRNPDGLDFPYEIKYISFEDFWTNGTSFVPLDSGTKLSNNGVYYILVSYSSTRVLTKEYYLFKVDVLGSTGEQYYILAGGIKREKAKVYYQSGTTEYSSYYIVNISYSDSTIAEKFQIVTNNYQQIKAYDINSTGSDSCKTVQYLITNYKNVDKVHNYYGTSEGLDEGIIPYQQFIFVTFLEPKDDILSVRDGSTTSGLYYITNDTAQTFVTSSTKQLKVIAYDDSIATDSVSIYWKKSYGITSNEIDLILEKDGRRVSVTKKSSGDYFYTTLTRSGSYSLKFIDTALNVQVFNSGMTSLPLVFIKDVHFTISYVNPTTEEEVETEMINKAVYNTAVTLKLNKLLVPYYLTSRFGSGKIITAYRNGEAYTDYEYESQNYSFTFSELGYYEVYMTAYNQSPTGEKQIRTEVYSFSIINAKESRYAYNFSGYQSYYIKSIIKNGMDVTNIVTKSLKTSTNTINVNGKEYLRNILISYYDQKTGSGRYQITICANDMLYLNNNQEMACFTFEFFINSRPVPIVVSVSEGGTTNKNVSVQFNAKNVYDSVGECYVIVGKETYLVDETTQDTVELILGDDESRGTHYIQVRTTSGNLLYSYKVNLTEPMNAWSVIAIIASVGAVIAIIFIIIRLRKRLGIK